MKIAIPTSNGILEDHFGHCEHFTIARVDPDTGTVVETETVEAPEHQPGLLPPWLKERGVKLVIAGNMGGHAQSLFQELEIQVLTGAPATEPRELLHRYLSGTLAHSPRTCDHHHEDGHHHGH